MAGNQERRAEDGQGRALIIPIGYRFAPRDHELILDYLFRKIMGFQLPSNAIRDVDIYEYDPNDLPTSDFKHGKTKSEAFYFTQRSSEGTKRSSKGGYWKACDDDDDDEEEEEEEEEIYHGDELVGFKTIFVWRQEVDQGIGKKKSWIMHEYRVNPSSSIIPSEGLDDDNIKAKMQRCVVCRIGNKDHKSQQVEIKAEEGRVDDI